MENLRETPPSALRLERIRQGIKPWRMCNLLGISQSLYYAYEQGRRRCPTDMRRSIARVLNVSVDLIFPAGYDEEMERLKKHGDAW
jgi:transcriptional regulator with XRE-family HTH domain